jgi:hypothetical protein
MAQTSVHRFSNSRVHAAHQPACLPRVDTRKWASAQSCTHRKSRCGVRIPRTPYPLSSVACKSVYLCSYKKETCAVDQSLANRFGWAPNPRTRVTVMPCTWTAPSFRSSTCRTSGRTMATTHFKSMFVPSQLCDGTKAPLSRWPPLYIDGRLFMPGICHHAWATSDVSRRSVPA